MQGLRFDSPRRQPAIKIRHDRYSLCVRDRPQTHDDRLRAGQLEGSTQAKTPSPTDFTGS